MVVMAVGQQHVQITRLVLRHDHVAQRANTSACITYDGLGAAFDFNTDRIATDLGALSTGRGQRTASSPEFYTELVLVFLYQIINAFGSTPFFL